MSSSPRAVPQPTQAVRILIADHFRCGAGGVFCGSQPISKLHDCSELRPGAAGLEAVDYVVSLEESIPESAIARLKPDVHCKDSEYKPPNGKPIPEATVVESYGGRIESPPMLPKSSTSDLLRKVFNRGSASGQ